METIQGKTAIVTGASSGIGAQIAKELAEHGVNVVLAARSEDKLLEVAKEIESKGKGKVLYVPTDIREQTSVETLVQKAEKTFGSVNILVNNAGQMLTGSITSGKVDEWEQMIDVNIKGTLFCIHAVLPKMLEAKSGHIINIASVSGFEVTKRSTIYSATKSAVRFISAGLEKELAQTGVRTTNISPGMVDTSLAEGAAWKEERKKLETKDIAQAVIYVLTQPDYVNVNEITVRPV
ncbi:MAG TPA: SDR family oxidoreductase [Bacillota bacterium]|nr:SDR family oxidoreductase [Bacillota bacterium]